MYNNKISIKGKSLISGLSVLGYYPTSVCQPGCKDRSEIGDFFIRDVFSAKGTVAI